jgi:hypothetical protein
LCIDSGEYRVMLRPGKVYKVVRPLKGDPSYALRVIDEEGEDYLYPEDWFHPIEMPAQRKRRLAAALAAGSE